MSSVPPVAALRPSPSKKKFRPSQQRGKSSKALSTTSAPLAVEEALPPFETEQPTQHEEVAQELVETPLEAVATTTTTTTATSPPSAIKAPRGRKRKTVAVGASRPTAPEQPLEPLRPAPPEENKSEPTLATYCSRFRSKRKKKEAAAAAPAVADALPESEPAAPQGPVVQIVNGEIVLQESSIVVAGSAKPDEDLPVVEEEAQLAVVGASYNSFVSRRAPQHWTVEETQLFYEALRQVGCDFGTMEAYFDKKRTRKQLKRKYQIETIKNPRLIQMALDPASKKEIDMSVFNVDSEDTQKVAAKTSAVPKRKRSASRDKSRASEPQVPPASKPSATVAPPRKAIEASLPALGDATLEEPLWPTMDRGDEEEARENVKDPLFEEEEGHLDKTLPSRVTLVPAGAAKNKSKRPKFRSRKIRK